MGVKYRVSFRICNMLTRTLVPGLSTLSTGLRSLRKEHGFTLRELDQITGINWGTLAGWENDRVRSISADAVGSLARAYGISTIDVMRRLGIPVRDLPNTPKKSSEPPSEPANQPEPYDLGGVRTMRLALVEVADVTIHAGREAWRTVGTFSVPEDLAVGRDVVMVRVVGECLGPEIQDGDMVLIDRGQLSPRSGAIVAVLLEDGELVVKRYGVSPEDRRPILLDNTGETMRPNGARVLGTVIYLSRKVY
jgi:transcriptional regulator with XRE-family HTH domain